MLRRALRDRIRGLARGEDPHSHVPADGSPIRTYTHDTVLRVPREEDGDDRLRLRELAERVTDIVTGFDELGIAERQARIESELAGLSCRRGEAPGASQAPHVAGRPPGALTAQDGCRLDRRTGTGKDDLTRPRSNH